MALSLVSTSRITTRCKRFCTVMGRTLVAGKITEGQVFACKDNGPGFSGWSQHAYGNAVDLMCAYGDVSLVAAVAIKQATKRTLVNGFRKVPAHVIIFHQSCWTSEQPYIHPYTGLAHDNHVHVDFKSEAPHPVVGSYMVGTPRCAGGTA